MRFLFTEPGVVGYGWSSQPARKPAAAFDVFCRASTPTWFRHSRLLPEVQQYVRLHSPPGTRPENVLYTLPSWLLVIALAVLPALVVRRALVESGRRRAGLCPGCGYDLRATPGRCPECGTSTGGGG